MAFQIIAIRGKENFLLEETFETRSEASTWVYLESQQMEADGIEFAILEGD